MAKGHNILSKLIERLFTARDLAQFVVASRSQAGTAAAAAATASEAHEYNMIIEFINRD